MPTPPPHPWPPSYSGSSLATVTSSTSLRGQDDSPASSGASPQLTPANTLSEGEFDFLFEHCLVQEISIFFQKEIPESFSSSQAQVEIEISPKELQDNNEDFLRDKIKDWLEGMEGIKCKGLLNEKKAKKKPNEKPQSDGDSEREEGSSKPEEETHKSEGDQKTTFSKYVEYLPSSVWKPYPGDPRGCLITKTSKQDVGCVNLNTLVLFQGECKNRNVYNIKSGVRQCACYLWHQLWWFRVVQGLDVRHVHGFVVCGPKCKDAESKIVLSLLKLSTCTKIGGRFTLTEYRQSNEVKSQIPWHTLHAFIHHDWGNPTTCDQIKQDPMSPGCMLVPPELLSKEHTEWKIVPSGTAALVIRLSLADESKEKAQDFVKQLDLGVRLLHVTSFIRDAKATGKMFIYLKVKTLASGKTWNEDCLNSAIFSAKDFLQNPECSSLQFWLDPFPKNGVSLIRRNNCTVCLMHDMGSQLKDTNSLPRYKDFCVEYLSLMELTLTVQKYLELVHGDIHEGNLVWGNGKLRFIDWDECCMSVLKRIVVNKQQKERYPDALIQDREAYTMVQLLLLFRDVARKYYGTEARNIDDEVVQELIGTAAKHSLIGIKADDARRYYDSLKMYLKTKQDDIDLSDAMANLSTRALSAISCNAAGDLSVVATMGVSL